MNCKSNYEPIAGELTLIEGRLATLVGEIRTQSSKERGFKDKHGFTGNGLHNDIIGAKAECSLAKYLNTFWCGTLDTFREKDVGGFFDVRAVNELDHRLIIRDIDDDDTYFVSVAIINNNYYIKGYILAKDAKKGMYLEDYDERGPAYFVPNCKLKDPCEIKGLFLNFLNKSK